MMTNQLNKFEVIWLLILLILIDTELQATTLRDNGEQVGDKRGHGPSGGAPNGGKDCGDSSNILVYLKFITSRLRSGYKNHFEHLTTVEIKRG